MVFSVQGSAKELLQAFNQSWLIAEQSEVKSVADDLAKTRFWGDTAQAQLFFKTWQEEAQDSYYLPGNMTAGNLFWILDTPFPLRKANESLEEYNENFVHQHFAFVNEEQQLCGLMLMYRRDKPTEWVLGLTKNNHLAPDLRTVVILSGFDLYPYIKSAEEQNIAVSSAKMTNNPHITQIKSPLIQNMLHHFFKEESLELNVRADRLTHLLRLIQVYAVQGEAPNLNKLEKGEFNTIRARLIQLERIAGSLDKVPGSAIDLINLTDFQPESLLAENPTLDLITKYRLSLTSAMLRDCLSTDSGLRKEIERLALSDDDHVNRNLLQMVVLFYEEKLLQDHRDFIEKQILIKTMGGHLWNEAQIQLMPFLLKNNYEKNLFQLVLSNKAFYSSILILIQLGYTNNISAFIMDPKRCEILEYINTLDNIEAKKLCLIFWAKAELSLEEYQKIGQATKDYPMLAGTLVSLDQTEVTHIKNLKKLALTPLEHQKLSILHYYSGQLDKAGSIKTDLKELKAAELADLIKAFSVLKKSGVSSNEAYILAIKNHKQGQLLRLFLPYFDKIDKEHYRQKLIEILYIGIENGPVTQGKAVKQIQDSELKNLAKNLHERFICAKQMQDLHFKKEIINLAADDQGVKGIRFRKVILRVEQECKVVQETLRESSADSDKVGKWQKIDKDYRRTLYSIAYDGITKAKVDLRPRINDIEKQVLNIVDPQTESWLYNALIIIANIVITTLTLGMANDIKKERTGNFWFFNQTPLGERLRGLDERVMKMVESPEPVPILAM